MKTKLLLLVITLGLGSACSPAWYTKMSREEKAGADKPAKSEQVVKSDND